MEQEVIEMVIREMLEEQKENVKKIKELSSQIDILSSQITEYKSLLFNIKLEVPPVDTFRIEGILFHHQEIAQRQLIELKNFIVLKSEKKEFWGKIYQWLPWLLVFLLCSVICRIAIG